jgi:integrase
VVKVTKKRKVKDEPIILDEYFLDTLLETVQKVQWPYKVNAAQLHQRDQALTSFLILAGVRNSETQKIRKKQTRIYKTHILIVNIETVKRGNIREKVILPKQGGLAPFTKIFEDWLTQVPHEEAILFPSANANGTLNWKQPLNRNRVHWIIKTTCGKFPHWFRGVCETIHGQQFFKNDAWALQKYMGLKSLDSTSPYVSSPWEKYTKNILEGKIKS